MRTNFRIICLKNQENRKYNDDRVKWPSNIVAINQSHSKSHEGSTVPNIVHLSARLQDDTFEEGKAQTLSLNKLNQRMHSNEKNEENADSIFHHKIQEIKRLKQQQIQRFFKTKQLSLNKYKNTMKNLLGPINFSSDRRREKKISKLIKETIKDVCAGSKLNKKIKEDGVVYSLANNRNQLETDFQTFLNNKNQQRFRKHQDPEESKLRRLSFINPEKQAVPISAREALAKPLNLYHFQSPKSQQKESLQKKPRNLSSSNVISQSHGNQARIDKKIFNHQLNLKTEQQQFQWSRIRLKGNKNYNLQTFDL